MVVLAAGASLTVSIAVGRAVVVLSTCTAISFLTVSITVVWAVVALSTYTASVAAANAQIFFNLSASIASGAGDGVVIVDQFMASIAICVQV